VADAVTDPPHVVVIGAGFAGLSAAVKLIASSSAVISCIAS